MSNRIRNSHHLVEFKVLPVTLIPGATVSGSEMIQHLTSPFHQVISSQSLKTFPTLDYGNPSHLIEQHLWWVCEPTWLSRAMLDQTSKDRYCRDDPSSTYQSNLSARAGARRAPRRRRARIMEARVVSFEGQESLLQCWS